MQPACIAADLGELAGPQRSYVGLGLHDLRHAAVALMREAGVPLEVASRRLGHSSIRTTADIYGSPPKQVDEEAADALGSAMARPRPWPAHHGQFWSSATDTLMRIPPRTTRTSLVATSTHVGG